MVDRSFAEGLVRRALSDVPLYRPQDGLRITDGDEFEAMAFVASLETGALEMTKTMGGLGGVVERVKRALPKDLFYFPGVEKCGWAGLFRFRGDIDVSPALDYLTR
jgi:hypothetical protein